MKRVFIIMILAMTATVSLMAAERSDVVAMVDGKAVTAADIEPLIAHQLTQVRQIEYDLRSQAIDQYVYEQLQKAAAAKEGITVDELRNREIDAKVGEPTSAEVEATMRQHRARLPQDDAEARRIVKQALENQRRQEREQAWKEGLMAKAKVDVLLQPVRFNLETIPGDVSRGPATAPVTIVEFSDFQCPYCARSQEMIHKLTDKYGEKIRLVFKQLPLDIHAEARFAAEASLCANEQGKFWPLHDWMFENPQSLTVEKMREPLAGMGIDADKLVECLDSDRHAAAVDAQVEQAQALGVRGTPTFFINGRRMSGASFDEFDSVIREELKKTGESQKSASH